MPPPGTAGAGAVLRGFANQSEPIPSPPVSGLRRSQTTSAHRPGTAPQRSLGARLSSTTAGSETSSSNSGHVWVRPVHSPALSGAHPRGDTAGPASAPHPSVCPRSGCHGLSGRSPFRPDRRGFQAHDPSGHAPRGVRAESPIVLSDHGYLGSRRAPDWLRVTMSPCSFRNRSRSTSSGKRRIVQAERAPVRRSVSQRWFPSSRKYSPS